MLAYAARSGTRWLRAFGVTAFAAAGIVLAASPAVHADPPDELADEIEAQYHDLEALIEDYNKVHEEYEDTKDQIADLEKDLKPYEDKLDVLYAEVGDIAANVYMGGNMSGLSALLTSGSPDTLADRLTALDQISVDDAAAIEELNDAKSSLDEQKAVLDDLYATQKTQNDDLEGKKDQIEGDIERLKGEWDTAYRDTRGLSDSDFVPEYVPGERGEVVRFALNQEGDSYVWAAEGPDGWDCSGLMLGAWSQVGVGLPHNAAAQWNQTTHISRDELQPGDLVFYNGLSHVAMYIGGDHVIHASTYGVGVIIQTVDDAGASYYGAGRIPGW